MSVTPTHFVMAAMTFSSDNSNICHLDVRTFIFISFAIPLVLGMAGNSLKKPGHFHIML